MAGSVTYEFGELDTLVPAYAATIHKSQGSEYPAVIIPVMTQHYAMLQRNLIYTGVTRGKKARRARWPGQGGGDCGKKHFRPSALDETSRMAREAMLLDPADERGLIYGFAI